MKKILLTLASFSLVSVSSAATVQFNLIGTAGAGLLFGNEPAVVTGGTGGEFGSGISFDDSTRVISINVHWGSANGFTNLTGNTTNAHLHITANPNGNDGVGDWRQTGGVVVNIQTDPVNFTTVTSSSAGSIVGTATLSAANETALMAGRLYLNVHTAANAGGEIRGFLTPVPEPAASLFGMATLGALALRRRRP